MRKFWLKPLWLKRVVRLCVRCFPEFHHVFRRPVDGTSHPVVDQGPQPSVTWPRGQ